MQEFDFKKLSEFNVINSGTVDRSQVLIPVLYNENNPNGFENGTVTIDNLMHRYATKAELASYLKQGDLDEEIPYVVIDAFIVTDSDQIIPNLRQTNTYPPEDWFKNNNFVIRESGKYLWVTYAKQSLTKQLLKWSDDSYWTTPTCLGPLNNIGQDSEKYNYVYALTSEPLDPSLINIINSGGLIFSVEDIEQQEALSSHNIIWHDRRQVVSKEYPYEYGVAASRINGTWGKFNQVFLSAHFGKDGLDGDGVEYIYTASTQENIFPDLYKDLEGNTVSQSSATYQSDEFIPLGWQDNPIASTEEKPYVYVSSRHKVNDYWTNFSDPVLWGYTQIINSYNGYNFSIVNDNWYIGKSIEDDDLAEANMKLKAATTSSICLLNNGAIVSNAYIEIDDDELHGFKLISNDSSLNDGIEFYLERDLNEPIQEGFVQIIATLENDAKLYQRIYLHLTEENETYLLNVTPRDIRIYEENPQESFISVTALKFVSGKTSTVEGNQYSLDVKFGDTFIIHDRKFTNKELTINISELSNYLTIGNRLDFYLSANGQIVDLENIYVSEEKRGFDSCSIQLYNDYAAITSSMNNMALKEASKCRFDVMLGGTILSCYTSKPQLLSPYAVVTIVDPGEFDGTNVKLSLENKQNPYIYLENLSENDGENIATEILIQAVIYVNNQEYATVHKYQRIFIDDDPYELLIAPQIINLENPSRPIVRYKHNGIILEDIPTNLTLSIYKNQTLLQDFPTDFSDYTTEDVLEYKLIDSSNKIKDIECVGFVKNGKAGETRGVSVQFSKSNDKNQPESYIHTDYQPGDIYMRFGSEFPEEGNPDKTKFTYGNWVYIKGEDGSSFFNDFAISQHETTGSSLVCPEDCIDESSWHDAPPTQTDEKPYIWCRITQSNNTNKYYIRVSAKDGRNGNDGITKYTWIRYADNIIYTNKGTVSENSIGMSDSPINQETGEFKEYIGFSYNQNSPIESDIYGDYKWSLFKGANGENGIDGADGEDGKTYYTWIKYSDRLKPGPDEMKDEPDESTIYIGIAVNKLSPEKSKDWNDYQWSKFRGDDGVNADIPEYKYKGSQIPLTFDSWNNVEPDNWNNEEQGLSDTVYYVYRTTRYKKSDESYTPWEKPILYLSKNLNPVLDFVNEVVYVPCNENGIPLDDLGIHYFNYWIGNNETGNFYNSGQWDDGITWTITCDGATAHREYNYIVIDELTDVKATVTITAKHPHYLGFATDTLTILKDISSHNITYDLETSSNTIQAGIDLEVNLKKNGESINNTQDYSWRNEGFELYYSKNIVTKTVGDLFTEDELNSLTSINPLQAAIKITENDDYLVIFAIKDGNKIYDKEQLNAINFTIDSRLIPIEETVEVKCSSRYPSLKFKLSYDVSNFKDTDVIIFNYGKPSETELLRQFEYVHGSYDEENSKFTDKGYLYGARIVYRNGIITYESFDTQTYTNSEVSLSSFPDWASRTYITIDLGYYDEDQFVKKESRKVKIDLPDGYYRKADENGTYSIYNYDNRLTSITQDNQSINLKATAQTNGNLLTGLVKDCEGWSIVNNNDEIIEDAYLTFNGNSIKAHNFAPKAQGGILLSDNNSEQPSDNSNQNMSNGILLTSEFSDFTPSTNDQQIGAKDLCVIKYSLNLSSDYWYVFSSQTNLSEKIKLDNTTLSNQMESNGTYYYVFKLGQTKQYNLYITSSVIKYPKLEIGINGENSAPTLWTLSPSDQSLLSELDVSSNKIISKVQDEITGLGSQIKQTKEGIFETVTTEFGQKGLTIDEKGCTFQGEVNATNLIICDPLENSKMADTNKPRIQFTIADQNYKLANNEIIQIGTPIIILTNYNEDGTRTDYYLKAFELSAQQQDTYGIKFDLGNMVNANLYYINNNKIIKFTPAYYKYLTYPSYQIIKNSSLFKTYSLGTLISTTLQTTTEKPYFSTPVYIKLNGENVSSKIMPVEDYLNSSKDDVVSGKITIEITGLNNEPTTLFEKTTTVSNTSLNLMCGYTDYFGHFSIYENVKNQNNYIIHNGQYFLVKGSSYNKNTFLNDSDWNNVDDMYTYFTYSSVFDNSKCIFDESEISKIEDSFY